MNPKPDWQCLVWEIAWAQADIGKRKPGRIVSRILGISAMLCLTIIAEEEAVLWCFNKCSDVLLCIQHSHLWSLWKRIGLDPSMGSLETQREEGGFQIFGARTKTKPVWPGPEGVGVLMNDGLLPSFDIQLSYSRWARAPWEKELRTSDCYISHNHIFLTSPVVCLGLISYASHLILAVLGSDNL